MTETWRNRAKRAMRGRITQEALAERLGTSQPGLSHWLNNRSQPDLDDINRIADEIGVSRVWLTHGLGPEAGPGKVLIDLLLNESMTEEELAPLAATAQALVNARKTKNINPAFGNPDLAAIMDAFARNPTSHTPESIAFLRQKMEAVQASIPQPHAEKARKPRRAKG